jgi:hypothetical protein
VETPASAQATLWRKSTRSAGVGECVEVGFRPGAVLVRDSKDPGGPVLTLEPEVWRDFLDVIRTGALDLER